MGFLDREVDLDVTASVNVDQLLVATPPDKEPVWQIFFTRGRVKESPAVAVVNLKPRLQVRAALSAAEFEATDHTRRNARSGEHHGGYVHEVGIAFDA